MSFVHLPTPNFLSSSEHKMTLGHSPGHVGGQGQQIHVFGVFIILLELVLTFENLLPILVCVMLLPHPNIGDKQICVFSILCILSALVPTPLGLVSYFSGGWYGGNTTCITYQVTSLWCSLSSLVLLSYMCVTCHLAVCSLAGMKNPHSSPNTLAPSSKGSARLKFRPNEYVNLGPSHDEHEVSGVRYHETKKHVIGKSVLTDSTVSRNIYSLLEFKNNGDSNRTTQHDSGLRSKENETKTEISANTKSYNSDSATNGDFSQLSDKLQRFPDVCLHSPKEKSILHLNLYKKSNRLKAMIRNDNIAQRYDKYSAVTSCLSWPARHHMTLTLAVLLSTTMTIALLPIFGLGPHSDRNDTSCQPWLSRKPDQTNKELFYLAFLGFVCLCLMIGCCCGLGVCIQVNRRQSEDRLRRSSTFFYEKEKLQDVWNNWVLTDMKRQYSLSCVALAGQLTWLPLLLILVLQTSGITVSDAVVMYSTVVTSLPGLLNPLLYSLVLSRYRSGYKAILVKRCCLRRQLNNAGQVSKNAQLGTDKNMNVSSHSEECSCHCDTSGVHMGEHARVSLEDAESDNNEASFVEEESEEDIGDDQFDSDFILTERTPLQATSLTTQSSGTFGFSRRDASKQDVNDRSSNHPVTVARGHQCENQSFVCDLESSGIETGL